MKKKETRKIKGQEKNTKIGKNIWNEEKRKKREKNRVNNKEILKNRRDQK